MRLPLLFRRENSDAARREREEAVEKVLTEGLRKLSQALTKLADVIEQRRLERGGYKPPGEFLERAPKPADKR